MNDYITTEELLAEHGLTPEDVRRRYPDVPEYTARDGNPFWERQLLAEWIVHSERGGPR